MKIPSIFEFTFLFFNFFHYALITGDYYVISVLIFCFKIVFFLKSIFFGNNFSVFILIQCLINHGLKSYKNAKISHFIDQRYS